MPHPKTWEYTVKAISEAAQLPIRNVRLHIDTGRLVPSDLRSVALFIAFYFNGNVMCDYSQSLSPEAPGPRWKREDAKEASSVPVRENA